MSWAQLGDDIIFEFLSSPETFRAEFAYHYAEHKVVEARPRLQWIAQELQKISLEMVFHVQFLAQTYLSDPTTAMNRLRAAGEDHQARSLIFGNGIHRGYFVIESIEETFVQTADDGSIVASQARVELHEWVPGADFDPQLQGILNTPAPAIIYSGNPAHTPLFLGNVPNTLPITPANLNPDPLSFWGNQPAPQPFGQ